MKDPGQTYSDPEPSVFPASDLEARVAALEAILEAVTGSDPPAPKAPKKK